MGSLRPLPGGTGCILRERRCMGRVLLRNTARIGVAKQASMWGRRQRLTGAPSASAGRTSTQHDWAVLQSQALLSPATGRWKVTAHTHSLEQSWTQSPQSLGWLCSFLLYHCLWDSPRPPTLHFILVPALGVSCLSPRPQCSSSLLGSEAWHAQICTEYHIHARVQS